MTLPSIHSSMWSHQETCTHQALATQPFLFLCVVEQFLLLCGFFSFVFHESTAGTTILILFLAKTLFYKHSLKVKYKLVFLLWQWQKCNLLFLFLWETSKNTQPGPLRCKCPLDLLLQFCVPWLPNKSCFSVSFFSSFFCWLRNAIISFFGNQCKTIWMLRSPHSSLALGYWAFIIPKRNWQHLILLIFSHRDTLELSMHIIMTPDTYKHSMYIF